MRPIALEMEGFLSYRDPCRLELHGIEAAAILGENGSGKTSLVEAICWALFGRGRGGPDAMVCEQASRAIVRFDFALGGRSYRVERQRQAGASGKSYLGLFVSRNLGEISAEENDLAGWKPVGGDSIRETQAAIEDLLGMDADLWMATAFIAQGKADAFTNLGPAERKALLFDLLELGLWGDLAEIAKDQQRRAEAEALAAKLVREHLGEPLDIEAAEATLFARQDALAAAEKATEEAEAALGEAAGEVVAVGADLARQRREAEEGARELERLKGEAQSLDWQIEEAQRAEEARDKKLDGIRLAEEALPALEREEAGISRSLADLMREEGEVSQREASRRDDAAEARAREAAAIEEIRILRQRGERLSAAGAGAVCPTCEQPVGEEHQERILAEISEQHEEASSRSREATAAMADAAEAAERWAARRREIQAAMASARDDREKLRAQIAERRVLVASAEALRAEAATGFARLERLRAAREEAAAAILAAEPDGARARERAEAIAGGEARLEEARLEREAAAEQAALRRREHVLAAQRVSSAEAALEQARTQASAIEKAERQRLQAEEDAADWKLLHRACGRDGIPALLLEAELGALEQEANGLLDRLSAGRLSLRLETLRALKGGGERETLEILVGDAGGERRLEALSGGERQCVDLALRAALSRILAGRAGRPVETLIIDEGFTALDAAHKQRTIEILSGLLSEFGCVLFVTHMEEMADAFPARILVSKDAGGSRAELSPYGDNAGDNR